VASRSLASDGKPYDDALNPDTHVGGGPYVRESLVTLDLTPGYQQIDSRPHRMNT
jgi:hypothetical protein